MTHSAKAAERGEPSYVWRSGQERRLQMARRWIDVGGCVLDDGCGLGAYLAAFGRYSAETFGCDVEFDRLQTAVGRATGVALAPGEQLPFSDNQFDAVFSNETIEHAAEDARYAAEMVRVLRPGGRILIYCPNRWNPWEQHGIYWRGEYHFGNKLFVNYLPDVLRNRLAPHVRTYTRGSLLRLFEGLPVQVVHHTRIFRGFDNVVRRQPQLGRLLQRLFYAFERTPLNVIGLSHLLILEKMATT